MRLLPPAAGEFPRRPPTGNFRGSLRFWPLAPGYPVGSYDFTWIWKELGLDESTWEKCVTSQKYTALIKGNQAEGVRRGVEQTPTLIIGDQKVNGVSYDEFKQLVDKALAEIKADSTKKKPAGKKDPGA